MKIAQVLIQSTQPFSDFQIDLTYPEGHPKAGQALDRVCLIGPNGAGKSSLLKLLASYLRDTLSFKSKTLVLFKLQVGDRFIYSVHINNNALLMRTEIDQEPMWMFELIRDGAFTMAFNRNYEQYCIGHEEEPELYEQLWLENNGDDIVVFQPADFAHDRTYGLTDVPPTKPHEAESLSTTFPFFNEVSPDRRTEFWALLIHLIHQREKAYREFAEAPAQRGKSEQVMKQEFAETYPEILPTLAKVWAPVLEPLGLAADVEHAGLPANVRDRLILHLKHKHHGAKVEYGDIGTGLRRLLFNIGHTWALYFHRKVQYGFCILEEPEAGLYPASLEGLVGQYEGLVQGSQMFVSTHHPGIAKQFDPAERLILSRDMKGVVTVRRSTLPAGAGLPEILASDFA